MTIVKIWRDVRRTPLWTTNPQPSRLQKGKAILYHTQKYVNLLPLNPPVSWSHERDIEAITYLHHPLFVSNRTTIVEGKWIDIWMKQKKPREDDLGREEDGSTSDLDVKVALWDRQTLHKQGDYVTNSRGHWRSHLWPYRDRDRRGVRGRIFNESHFKTWTNQSNNIEVDEGMRLRNIYETDDFKYYPCARLRTIITATYKTWRETAIGREWEGRYQTNTSNRIYDKG